MSISSEPSLRRFFFALWPDGGLSRKLGELGRELPRGAGRLHHPEDFHLTLVFLGSMELDQLSCAEAVADEVRGEPFTLRLDRIGYWPRPRIAWLGCHGTPAPLLSLVADLQERLESCGFQPESRRYKPHVTLVRKAEYQPSRELSESLQWRVKEFVLAGGHSGPKPPRYQVLKRWSLLS